MADERPRKASSRKKAAPAKKAATVKKAAAAKKAASVKKAATAAAAAEPAPAPAPTPTVDAEWVATTVRAAAEQARSALAVANDLVDQARTKATERDDSALRVLRTRYVQDAASEHRFRTLLNEAVDSAQARKRTAGESADAHRQMLAGLADDLDELVRML